MIQELDYILDPIHGNISVTKLERKIIESTLFNRLNYITQLSTVFFVHPSANHVRSSHSIGVMYLSSKYFTNAINNSSEDVQNKFLVEYHSVIQDILKSNKKCTKADRHSDTEIRCTYSNRLTEELRNFNFNIFKTTNEDTESFYILLQAVRIAALLHDVGHLPFSHLAETSLDSVYNLIKDKGAKTQTEDEFCSLYDSHVAENDPLHEILGEKIIALIFEEIFDTQDLDDDYIQYVELIQTIVNNIIVNYYDTENNIDFKILHNVIAGMIDVDRLDYVTRDISSLGAKITSYDLEKILLNTVLVEKDKSFFIGLRVCIVEEVEHFLESRFHLYNSFLFSASAVKKYQILNQVLIRSCVRYLQDENNVDDKTSFLYELPLNISGLWCPLKIIDGVLENYYDATDLLFQYDESWLLYILKMEYFKLEREFYKSKNNFIDKPRTRKHFYGLREILFGENIFIPLWDSKNSFANFCGIEQKCVSLFTSRFVWGPNKKVLVSFFKELITKYEELDIYFATRQFKNGYEEDFILFENDTVIVPIKDISPIGNILQKLAYNEAPFYFYIRDNEGNALKRQEFEYELKSKLQELMTIKEKECVVQ